MFKLNQSSLILFTGLSLTWPTLAQMQTTTAITDSPTLTTTQATAPVGALPATALPVEANPAPNRLTGELPYSNQWVFDKRSSFLYLTYNHGQLAQQTLQVGNYTSSFSSTRFDFPSLDYFARLFNLGNPEGRFVFRNVGLWMRYGFGGGTREGKLQNSQVIINSQSETAQLIALFARLGLNLSFDALSWIQPYAGIELTPFFYRHSASLSGADSQALGYLFGPVAGVHIPLFFAPRVGIYGEFRRDLVARDDNNVFGTSSTFDAGIGVIF